MQVIDSCMRLLMAIVNPAVLICLLLLILLFLSVKIFQQIIIPNMSQANLLTPVSIEILQSAQRKKKSFTTVLQIGQSPIRCLARQAHTPGNLISRSNEHGTTAVQFAFGLVQLFYTGEKLRLSFKLTGTTRSWNCGWGGPSPPPSLESGIDSIASPPEGEKAADAACAVG